MTKRMLVAIPILALLLVSTQSSRADLFSRIENSPSTYWVPDPTPGPAGYAQQPQPYYGYGPGPYVPPPGYYGPPPPPPGPPVVVVPRFFIGFHFH